MNIKKIESEFGDKLPDIINYYNNPKNDYSGKGFGIDGIAGILEIDPKTLRKYIKKHNIKILHRQRITPLEDYCLTKYFIDLKTFLKREWPSTKLETATAICTWNIFALPMK